MDYGWTIEKPYWTALKNTLGDKSQWKISRLRETGVSSIPAKPGVYMLCARPLLCEETFVVNPESPRTKGLYNALYIGESTNLSARYRKYATMRDDRKRVGKFLKIFSGKIDFCYWVIEKADKAHLREVQNLLILCFGPSVNTQGGGDVLIGIGLKPVAA